MQIGEAQNLFDAFAEIHGKELRAVFASRKKRADELADAGAIEVSDVTKIQQNFRFPILKKVHEEPVNGFSLNQRKSSANINDGYIAQLPSTRAESQQALPEKMPAISVYRNARW